MQTNKIKQYAPKARTDFIKAITKKANQLGIYQDNISDAIEMGGALQIEGKSFDITYKSRREKLIKSIEQSSFDAVIEKIAYSWFNRLCALRYMELHGYLDHGFRVLSNTKFHPSSSNFGSTDTIELLENAKDAADDLGLNKETIIDLQLAGNKQEELYRILLLAQCHQLHQAMPFLFEAVNDETELLLPEGLTRTDSLIKELVTAIPEEDWDQVEIIGWLYQFYISEKKDEVIGKVVKSEDIPAATQLFTPNWIVKYLVQNSVGRQWMQTYPDSGIKSEMEYYIEPAAQTDEVNQQLKFITPDSIDPEEIKILDPACGSGHILVEAYSLLKEIYIERGYRNKDFPQLILEKNIYGLDIDDRAAQLAGFALMMKAREDDRRIFTRDIKLNVLSIQESSHLNFDSLWQELNLNGEWKKGTSQGLFDEVQIEVGSDETDDRYLLIKRILERFIQAKTFGSLCDIPSDELTEINELLVKLEQLAESGDTMQIPASNQLIPYIKQALILAQKYDSVVANPPYMGGKGMNAELKKLANDNYPNSKSDLFAIFMERAFNLLNENGFNAQINMQSWMFLSSYEKLREWLLETKTIVTMAHLGARAFGQISGEVVQTTAWILNNLPIIEYRPVFFRLIDGNEDIKKHNLLANNKRFDKAVQSDFNKIPESPIAYWLPIMVFKIFEKGESFKSVANPRTGMSTSDTDRFLKLWPEVSFSKIGLYLNKNDAITSSYKWFPFSKGGPFRRWYGNNEYVVNYENNGAEVKHWLVNNPNDPSTNSWARYIRSPEYYFRSGLSWTKVTSSGFSVRLSETGYIFSDASNGAFPEENELFLWAGFLNSCVSSSLLSVIAPTLNFKSGDVARIPVVEDIYKDKIEVDSIVKELIKLSKNDWNSYEVSWDFRKHPLTLVNSNNLSDNFNLFIRDAKITIYNTKKLEENNNNIFIDSYGFNELYSPEVAIQNISLNVNPKFRYGKGSKKELDNHLQSDTLSELISYSIGCMMGRYSLDRDGLVYAHASNEGFKELESEGAYKTFPADDDGIIPLTDMEWFDDDATFRFKEFLIAVWGNEPLQENIQFVADSLNLHALKPKKDESPLETIRRYFTSAFYKQHLKTYKKRPIYWLFSSGKQKAFEALVYLHRYNESTLARMRTEYVSPLMGKYQARAESLQLQAETSTGTEARRIEKELKLLNNKQTELRTFDDKLKHYADMKIPLDLDDGVKVNYGKFGDLLAEVKAVTGNKPVVSGHKES